MEGFFMPVNRYTITDVSGFLGVESHVLRYWEEELEIPISRNELGHRYYLEKDIRILQCVKELKSQGLLLKAIKRILPSIMEGDIKLNAPIFFSESGEDSMGQSNKKKKANNAAKSMQLMNKNTQVVIEKPEQETAVAPVNEKLIQFEDIMYRIMRQALHDNNETVTKDVVSGVSREVVREVSQELTEKLDGCFKEQEKRDENHYKELDQMMRSLQKNRKETAKQEDRKLQKQEQKRLQKEKQQKEKQKEKEAKSAKKEAAAALEQKKPKMFFLHKKYKL
ncbi:MAG: helix-turn-helix domain-containing protein [Lachnospiraceae bacterium]